jgi:hypothetical protein
MLDNLRNQSSFQEEQSTPEVQEQPKPQKRRKTLDQMTGMTAPQRFFLALMLLVIVCLLGTMALVVTGTVYLPF